MTMNFAYLTFQIKLQLKKTYLVRLGGAGAVFPFLLVVLRICTAEFVLPVDEKVLNFDDEPVSE